MNYTFIALVENKPGVLNRVASLFRRRNFNIESLAVGRTEKPEISRMTVVVDCPNGDYDAHKIEANLYKLVNVIDVQDVTHQPSVTRDLALIKVMVGPDKRAEVGPEKRAEVNSLAEIFRARIVDVAADRVDRRNHWHRGQDRRHDRVVTSAGHCGNGPHGTGLHDPRSQRRRAPCLWRERESVRRFI